MSISALDRVPWRLLYSPKEAEQLLGISHATLYRLIAERRLEARKINGKTVISRVEIDRFLAALPSAVLRS